MCWHPLLRGRPELEPLQVRPQYVAVRLLAPLGQRYSTAAVHPLPHQSGVAAALAVVEMCVHEVQHAVAVDPVGSGRMQVASRVLEQLRYREEGAVQVGRGGGGVRRRDGDGCIKREPERVRFSRLGRGPYEGVEGCIVPPPPPPFSPV